MSNNKKIFIIRWISAVLIFLEVEATEIDMRAGKSISSLRSILKPKDNPMSRILRDSVITRQKHEGFECDVEWPDIVLKDTLICYCTDNTQIVDINYDPGYITRAWEEINNEIIKNNGQDHLSSLYLINCSFSIGNKALEQLKLSKLSEVYIAGSGSLVLAPQSLVFTSTNVNVTVFQIQHQFLFPNLQSSISTLVLEEVSLRDFSTDNFIARDTVSFGRSGSILNNVVIKNSLIHSIQMRDRLRSRVRVNSFTLDNVKFKKPPRYPFVNLQVEKEVIFKNLLLEASNEEIIAFRAKSLLFENCTIKNWRETAIVADINHVNFHNTKLQEPQKHALMHLRPNLKEFSTLSLINVTLDDPAEGTLATRFPKVYYDNIRVERCKCDLVQTLLASEDEYIKQLADQSVRTLARTFNLTVNNAIPRLKMKAELSKHILCHPRNDASNEFKWIHPKTDCNGPDPVVIKETDTRSIIAIMIGLVVTVSIIGIIVLLCWRRKVKEKADLINKWKLHPPKQPKAVDRTEMSVRYIPGVEIEESSTLGIVEFEVEMRNSHAPDIVQDAIFYDSLTPNHAKSMAKSLESLDESQRGSVIIHDDIDDEYM